MTNTKKVFFWLFEFNDYEHSFCMLTKKGNQYHCTPEGKGGWYGNLKTNANPLQPFKKHNLKQKIAGVLYGWRENKGKEYKTLRDKKSIPEKVLQFIETLE